MYSVTTSTNKSAVSAVKIADFYNLTIVAKSAKRIVLVGTSANVARFIALFAGIDSAFQIERIN